MEREIDQAIADRTAQMIAQVLREAERFETREFDSVTQRAIYLIQAETLRAIAALFSTEFSR